MSVSVDPLRRSVRDRAGFSLVEAMFAMLLVFTLLGLTAALMRQYSNVARHAAARDESLDGVQFALAEMAHELGSAVAVTASGTSLRLNRVDPNVVRFPTIPDGAFWNPRDSAMLMDVHYYREPGTSALIRETSGSGGSTRQSMAPHIDGLRADRQGSTPFFLLALTFQEKQRIRRFTTQARVWATL